MVQNLTLDEYLEALDTTPDGDIDTEGGLHKELGVYDNFTILLRYEFSKVRDYFLENKEYELGNETDFSPLSPKLNAIDSDWSTVLYSFTHKPTGTIVQVCNWVAADLIGVYDYVNRYNITLSLHFPLSPKDNEFRAVADTIKDIGSLIQREKIPHVFPFTGTSYESCVHSE